MSLCLTQAEFDHIRQAYDPVASRSGSIHSDCYLDARFLEVEREQVFHRSWQFLCHEEKLREPGSYVATDVQGQSIFVARDQDGELRGFYNVCRHRGHELLSGQGKINTITCPYHAWVYNLDGSLRRARRSELIENFCESDIHLMPIQVETFCHLIFVNLDAGATSLGQQSGDLRKEILSYAPDLGDLTFAHRLTYQLKANWKAVLDNFLECYHCDPAHRDFVDLVDMNSYRSSVNGIYSRHISTASRSTDNSAYRFEKGKVDFGYAGWFLWPNLTIWIYPGDPNISVLQMIPAGIDRTIENQDWFLPAGSPSTQLKEAMIYQKDVLQPEDIRLCESVQRGLKSKGYNQGRFVVDASRSELSEHAVHHFQSMVTESLASAD